MKLFKFLLFIVGILVSVNLSAQDDGGLGSTSACILRVHNPECCPGIGTAGATHPVNGPANNSSWQGHGVPNVHLFWGSAFPAGGANVHFWAKTATLPAGDNVDYDSYYCYGSTVRWIGYHINLTADVYMEFYTIINPVVID